MKAIKVDLEEIKYSDGWMDLCYDLFEGESDDSIHTKANKIFEYGEYGNIEIEVDENLNIIGGRIIPFKEDWNE